MADGVNITRRRRKRSIMDAGTILNALSQRQTGTGTNTAGNFRQTYYNENFQNYNPEILPHDNAAEQAVIGAVLILGAIPQGLSLRPDYFYREQHRIVWHCLEMLSARGETIDILSVQRELARMKRTIAPSFLTSCLLYSNPPAIDPFTWVTPQEYAKECADRVLAAFRQRRHAIQIDAILQAVWKGRYTEAIRMLQDIVGGA